jgi:hypothetical protein
MDAKGRVESVTCLMDFGENSNGTRTKYIKYEHEKFKILFKRGAICISIRKPITLDRSVQMFLNGLYFVGFEVLTPVVMKSSIFWDITPCSPLTSQLMFRRSIPPPSSGSKNKPSKEPA